jgi:hypothetical protein
MDNSRKIALMTHFHTTRSPTAQLNLNSDDMVTIRRRPNERHVTIRSASHITNTPMEIVKQQLEQFGTFTAKHYIVSAHLPKE